ncbi:MAG: hypothetical protein Q9175_007527, partial [Cornicularia normoerica]
MDLPPHKGTGFLLHKVTHHHRHKDILHLADIRTLYLPLPSPPVANLQVGHKLIQAIHLLRGDHHHSQAMEGMGRHHPSSHQDRTVEDISRHHRQRARATGRLYLEGHITEDDQASPPHTRTRIPRATIMPQGPHPQARTTSVQIRLITRINYFGQKGQLRGCINDVKNMSTYLNGNFGYAREDMVILTDDQQNPMSQPTRLNILRAMHWLVKDAKPNDSLFFHYSGHGGQTPDKDGDEDDGYDEVIYPVDFRQTEHIVDDEMHRIMVQSLMPGVRLTAIFDSCHSGSALDLPYIYSTQGVLKEPNLAKEAGQGLLSIVSQYARGDIGGIASTAIGLFKKATSGEEISERNKITKTSPADVIMWSGSKDDQTSQDAQIAGQATGAMSWAFISALKKNPQQSYVGLLNSIRDELESKYTQKPQLSCSHPL